MSGDGGVPELLGALGAAASLEAGRPGARRRLPPAPGAAAGVLAFRPPHGRPLVVAAGRARGVHALRRLVAAGGHPGAVPGVRRVPLGRRGRAVGELALIGVPPRARLPAGLARELGAAIERAWALHRRLLRITVLSEITGLLGSTDAPDDVLRAFAGGVARLVDYDSMAVGLLDVERGEFEVVDVVARTLPDVQPRDTRLPLERTLLAQLVATGQPVLVDDLAAADVPAASRAVLSARGWRAALLAPLVSRGGVFGAVILVAGRRAAFGTADAELVAELARPLASAMEQRRLLEDSRRRAEELAALYATSQLITSRLDIVSVLDRIARAVTSLTASTGCGIGLLDPDGARLVHAAAHGYRSEEWRALTMPVGEGIMGRCAETGGAIRVDDVRRDPRSARRDVDEREGIRSMLCVPLRVAGTLLGVISAFSTRPAAFSTHHQQVLEAFADQAGIAIQNARLFEESVRHARQTRALLQAGRAVTASLDLDRTIHVIMEQARAVLGVESCGIMTLDPRTRVLSSVASLDLPPAMASQIRVREGEGVTGQAVLQGRPVQSSDLENDPRVQYPQLPRASGLRSMMAAPLRVGNESIGAIVVLRRDVHRFTPAEEELLLALADQAAIAMEHARLYEHLEGMVAARTLELDRQRQFVEVVLETLPLGLFVLDSRLRAVRANREGARVLAAPAAAEGQPLEALVPDGGAEVLVRFVAAAFEQPGIRVLEQELVRAGETKTLRLTTAPLGAGDGGHVVLLVEDITRAKHLERQMLLAERLTTAGRLAAGVAHELNNPLATIAGCAESLSARLAEGGLGERPELADFRDYLRLIEDEAFRCKEITGSLLQFVREPGDRRVRADLNALATRTLELLSRQSRFTRACIVTELDPELPPVVVNEGQLRQVFLAIGANALEAMDGRGRLTVRTRRADGEVHVEFEDEGPGIPDDIVARIFDPFFTTKPPGQGTGLGLAIAQSIVNDHAGRIEVRPRVAKGALFRVTLPA